MPRIVLLALSAAMSVLPWSLCAQDRGSLDKYSCKEFLKVKDQTSVPQKTRRLMMLYWAAGYASAFRKDAPRSDNEAITIIDSVLRQSCLNDPNQSAIQAIVNTVGQFASNLQADRGKRDVVEQPQGSPAETRGILALLGTQAKRAFSALLIISTCQPTTFVSWKR